MSSTLDPIWGDQPARVSVRFPRKQQNRELTLGG